MVPRGRVRRIVNGYRHRECGLMRRRWEEADRQFPSFSLGKGALL